MIGGNEMKCFNCGYDHIDENIGFCPVCGVDLSKLCQKCHAPNPKMAQFCLTCGTELVHDLNEEERHLKAGIIFADISGFTTLAEAFSPEETKEIINECFRLLTEPIYHNGGVVDKYIGDCVMAVFGTKEDTIDIPYKTVLTAIQMKRALEKYHKQALAHSNISLNVSIGVTYGEVALGHVGSIQNKDYTVIGDVVNVASRFQTSAAPGEILAGESIYQLTKDRVKYTDSQLLSLKNKQQPIPSYKVIKTIQQATQSTYVHRDIETAIWQYLLKKPTTALLLMGEAGCGKTTTVKHIVASDDSLTSHNKIKQVYIECRPIHQVGYGVINELLRKIIGVSLYDQDEDVKRHLKEFLMYLYQLNEKELARPYLLLSILMKCQRDSLNDHTVQAMAYDDLIAALKKEFTEFMRLSAERSPVSLFIDNAEYMDEQSALLIESIVNVTHVVLIARKPLDTLKHLNKVTMKAYEKETFERLLNQVFDDEVNEEIKEALYETSGGNPLYVETGLKLLKQSINNKDKTQNIVRTIEANLPKSIELLYQQRINELPKTIKKVLQFASVFQDLFSFEDIQTMLSINERVSDYEQFIDSVTTIQDEVNMTKLYRFRDLDMKLSLYDGLLEKTKIKYHHQVALYYIDKNTVTPSLVAYHLQKANQAKAAASYYLAAAKKARQLFELEQSNAFYASYLSLLDEPNELGYQNALVERIKILKYMAMYDEVINLIDAELEKMTDKAIKDELSLLKADIYKSMGDVSKALPIIETLEGDLQKTSRHYGKLLQLKSTIYNMTGQPGVIELCDESKSLLIKARDYESLVETLSEAGIRYFIDGKIQEAIHYLEEGLKYANQANNKASLLKIIGNLGIFYNQFGEREKSHIYLKNAMQIANELNNQRHYVSAAINLAISYMNMGLFDQALTLLEESNEITKESNFMYHQCLTFTNLGDLYYELGSYDLALNQYKMSMELAEKMDMPIEVSINQLGIQKTHIAKNLFKEVEKTLFELVHMFKDKHEMTYVALTYFALTDYYIKNKELNKALDMIEKPLVITQESNDQLNIFRAMRKKLDVLCLVNEGSVEESLIQETILFGEQQMFHYELAHLYFMLYRRLTNGKQETYLLKAKEETMFFDECLLSKNIDKAIQISSK